MMATNHDDERQEPGEPQPHNEQPAEPTNNRTLSWFERKLDKLGWKNYDVQREVEYMALIDLVGLFQDSKKLLFMLTYLCSVRENGSLSF